ncbi:MAG: hypothetical protein ACRDGS_06305, partial [Chloroflexota bacterium]
PVLEFCAIPLALAHATVDAHANGHGKLSRDAVLRIVEQTISGSAPDKHQGEADFAISGSP